MLLRLLMLFVAAIPTPLLGADLEFEGTPSVRVLVTAGVAQTESLTPIQAKEFRVVIVRDGEGFVWASRNNVPLIKRESGAYVTYVAATGAGYVRIFNPGMRKLRDSLSPDQREKEFVYMEHLITQMGSVTYFGK